MGEIEKYAASVVVPYEEDTWAEDNAAALKEGRELWEFMRWEMYKTHGLGDTESRGLPPHVKVFRKWYLAGDGSITCQDFALGDEQESEKAPAPDIMDLTRGMLR